MGGMLELTGQKEDLGYVLPPTHPPTHPPIHLVSSTHQSFSIIHPPTHPPTYLPTHSGYYAEKFDMAVKAWNVWKNYLEEKEVKPTHPPTHPTHLYPLQQHIQTASFSSIHPPTHPLTHIHRRGRRLGGRRP